MVNSRAHRGRSGCGERVILPQAGALGWLDLGLWLGLVYTAIPPGTEARISKGIFPVVKFARSPRPHRPGGAGDITMGGRIGLIGLGFVAENGQHGRLVGT